MMNFMGNLRFLSFKSNTVRSHTPRFTGPRDNSATADKTKL